VFKTFITMVQDYRAALTWSQVCCKSFGTTTYTCTQCGQEDAGFIDLFLLMYSPLTNNHNACSCREVSSC